MDKPTIILATSNGIGMGHLARATAVAEELKNVARPILVSVAGGIAEIPSTTGIPCEYIPGKTRRWMPAHRWDRYKLGDADRVMLAQILPYSGQINRHVNAMFPQMRFRSNARSHEDCRGMYGSSGNDHLARGL